MFIQKKVGGRMPTGEKIKEFRKKRGLTQKQLGDLCGMADSAIRRYENGRANPKIETLRKIADALEVNVTELLNDGAIVGSIITDNILQPNAIKDVASCNETVKSRYNKYLEKNVNTIAAHFDGEEFTDEEMKQIIKFAEFVKSKRKKSDAEQIWRIRIDAETVP